MASKLIKAFKILVIIFMVMAIALVSLIHWKSDSLIALVLDAAENQLTDSLRYESVNASAFTHFPNLAVTLNQIQIGSDQLPFVKAEHFSVTLSIWSVLRNELSIRQINLENGTLNIVFQNNKWSYEILKPSSDDSHSSWSTKVDAVQLKNMHIHYHDGREIRFTTSLASAYIKGVLGGEETDVTIEANGVLENLHTAEYATSGSIPLQLQTQYAFSSIDNLHTFSSFAVHHQSLSVVCDGSIQTKDDENRMDIKGSWKKGKPAELDSLLPADWLRQMKGFQLGGSTEGSFAIQSHASGSSPVIQVECNWSDGEINMKKTNTNINHLQASIDYTNAPQKNAPELTLHFEKKSTLAKNLSGVVSIDRLHDPRYTIQLSGQCPATILNLMSADLAITEGSFTIGTFSVSRLNPKKMNTFWKEINATFSIDDVKGNYLHHEIEIPDADISADGDGTIEIESKDLRWSALRVPTLSCSAQANDAGISYTLKSQLCDGNVSAAGEIVSTKNSHTISGDWRVSSVDIKSLMTSFSNFDQTFITDQHLSGVADIWAEIKIPTDENWIIQPDKIVVKSALEIKNGRLKNLKTLEDFSTYIHVEDLRDIQFKEMRNYLKIEDDKVWLPVMFIQSSAINLSIAGVHSFDQRILYNVKINAGQTVANKLRKTDFRKDVKPARKSGWINMFFVLEGSTANVKYQQYRTAVISGFEQSTQLKENLRQYLVDRFGYDVYWIEPNEWEEIPEYK